MYVLLHMRAVFSPAVLERSAIQLRYMSAESAPLRWSAYEHEHIERGSDWFWALGITAAATAVTSVLFGNVLFALLILAGAGTFVVIARRPAPLVQFELSDRGVRIDDELHSYEEILSFWVEEHAERPLLLIDTVKVMAPNLIIPIEGEDPERIRAYLQERCAEVPMKEPLAHKLIEVFGL